jgi:hypothetical protein
MDAATQWGLPPGFQPARFSVPDGVKEVVRGVLHANEPVIVSITNEGDNISVIATPERVLAVRAGGAGAGVTGFSVKEYPWAGITNLVLQQMALNAKYAIHYRTSDGRTVEIGRRAAMGKPAIDNLMPFESEAGAEAFEALHSVWQHKKAAATD